MSAPKLTKAQSAKVAAFGFALYAVGDADPTPEPWFGGTYCGASSYAGRACTWERGHEHPQHIAGNSSYIVVEVWNVS